MVGRLVIAVVLIIAAIFVFTFANVCVIRCHSIVKGNEYQCSIETSMGGFFSKSESQIESARTVKAEIGDGSRVIISNDQTTIATPWLQHPFHSSEEVANEINTQFDFRSLTSFQLYQVEGAPAAISAAMLLIGISMLFSSVRKMTRR